MDTIRIIPTILLVPFMALGQKVVESKPKDSVDEVRKMLQESADKSKIDRLALIRKVSNEFAKEDLGTDALPLAMELISRRVVVGGLMKNEVLRIFGEKYIREIDNRAIAVALERSRESENKIVENSVRMGGLPFKMGPQWFLMLKFDEHGAIKEGLEGIAVIYCSNDDLFSLKRP